MHKNLKAKMGKDSFLIVQSKVARQLEEALSECANDCDVLSSASLVEFIAEVRKGFFSPPMTHSGGSITFVLPKDYVNGWK